MNKHQTFWRKSAILVASVIFLFGVAALLAFTVALGLDVMERVFPDPADWWRRWLGVFMFEGMMLIWFLAFITTARGVKQRTLSLVMCVMSALGVLGMVVGGMYLTGQTLVDVPAWVAERVFQLISAAAWVNVVAGLIYKGTSPTVLQAIQFQNLEDNLMDEAVDRTNAQMRMEAAKLSSFLAAQMSSKFKWEMGLPMTQDEMKFLGGEVVEGTVTVAPALPGPKHRGWLRRLFGFFGNGGDEHQSTPTTSELNSNEPSDQLVDQMADSQEKADQ